MKNVKKILTLVISGLAVVGFVLCLVSSVLAVLGGGLSIIGIIVCLAAAALEIIGLVKSVIFFISAFKADVSNWSTQKDCIRLIRSVAILLLVAGLLKVAHTTIGFIESVARSGGAQPSDAAIERLGNNILDGIGAFICGVFASIFVAVAVGRKSDEKPVRKVALIIGMLFVWGGVASAKGFFWFSAVGLWLFVAMGVATVVYAFFKPVKEVAAEEVAEEPAAEEPVQE